MRIAKLQRTGQKIEMSIVDLFTHPIFLESVHQSSQTVESSQAPTASHDEDEGEDWQ